MLLSGRSQYEKATYYLTFWKRQNYGDNLKNSGCRRVGEGRVNRQGTEDF